MNFTQNKFLNDEEIRQLRNNLATEKNPFYVLVIEAALYTGARSAEILEITTCDINKGMVTIRGKKNSNDRTVPLPAAYFKKLQAHAKTCEAGSRIFNITTRTFRRIWNLVRPSVNKTLHSLRHTMGVKLYNNCEDIHAVKTMLGHKNVQNTMTYLDYVEGNKKLKTSIKGMWSNKLDQSA